MNGALWWLVIELLIGGTLANQASKSRGITEPPNAQNKDGKCWRLAWAWWKKDLGRLGKVTDTGARELASLISLIKLDLFYDKNLSYERASGLRSLATLTYLNLNDCINVIDVGIQS